MAHEVKVIQLHGRTPEADESVLQALAQEGWELVQIDPQPASRWYYLRRDKPEQSLMMQKDIPHVCPPDVEPAIDIAPHRDVAMRPLWKRLLGIGDTNA